MSNKHLALGFAIGLGVGAIIGLLYAPESGDEARQDMRGKGDILGDLAERFLFKLRWIVTITFVSIA